jgi:RNA polymerase sigma-70 factor (ECF subfamily)
VRDQGDEEAWRRFFTRYAPMIWRLARHMGMDPNDADSVVQETLIAAIRAIRQEAFDPAIASFKTFLQGIIRNKVADKLRRRYRQTHTQDAIIPIESIRADAPGIWETYEEEWEKATLQLCLDQVRVDVTPQTYQAFDLYVFKEWPVEKVASFLDMTPNAVYIAKSRVVSHIRECWAELAGEEEDR